MKFLFGFLGMAGVILLFGGVSIIDASRDMFTMGMGFAISMIGLLSIAVFALCPAYVAIRFRNSETDNITGGN